MKAINLQFSPLALDQLGNLLGYAPFREVLPVRKAIELMANNKEFQEMVLISETDLGVLREKAQKWDNYSADPDKPPAS